MTYIHYRKRPLCRVSEALGKVSKTLDKKKRSANYTLTTVSLPITFYRGLDKDFTEY
jgi:hypothetical protein